MSWMPDNVVAIYKGYTLGYDDVDENESIMPFILYPDGVDDEIVPLHFIEDDPSNTLKTYVDYKPYKSSDGKIARIAKKLLDSRSEHKDVQNRIWNELSQAIYGEDLGT